MGKWIFYSTKLIHPYTKLAQTPNTDTRNITQHNNTNKRTPWSVIFSTLQPYKNFIRINENGKGAGKEWMRM